MSRDQAEKALEESIEVYYTKIEDLNREREDRKAALIKWTLEQLDLGPRPGGCRHEIPEDFWGFSYWGALRDAAMAYHDGTCALCGGPAKEVHHVMPRRYGGKDHPRNVVTLCTVCHRNVHARLEAGIVKAVDDSLNVGGMP